MKRTKHVKKKNNDPLPAIIEDDYIEPISKLPREWIQIQKAFREKVFPVIVRAANKEHKTIENIELKVNFTDGISFTGFSYER
jgi:hypothetical protein